MSKEEFIRILKEQLAGTMPAGEIQSHLRYYEQYIEEEIRKGRQEREITAALGDPRLIAKTLIDTSDGAGEEILYEQEREQTHSGPSRSSGRAFKLDLSTWYGKALLILIAVAIIALVVTVLSALLPVILIVFLVSVAARYFRR